ncbi:hypothetical protein NIES4106_57350 (plasmid) [Fischerella sp. NIES-4106]|nr:hypothetical protein NIES4106_57350 [Fischerella sp. NIES-4106]
MQESVIYQDILQKGDKQGEERTIIRQLNRRFGEIDSSLIGNSPGRTVRIIPLREELW